MFVIESIRCDERARVMLEQLLTLLSQAATTFSNAEWHGANQAVQQAHRDICSAVEQMGVPELSNLMDTRTDD